MKSVLGYLINSFGYHIIKLSPRPFIKEIKGSKIGVEVGTFRGKTAEEICKYNKNIKLFCVDPYSTYEDNKECIKSFYGEKELENAEKEARKRLFKYKVFFIKKKSENAIKGFKDKSLDFVYIDGNHEYLEVLNDLEWFWKVKRGGIFAGHDVHILGVLNAVSTFCVLNKLNFEVKYPDWIIRK